MKLFSRGSNLIESYDNVGIILKFKDIRFEHKTFTDKRQPCNHEQSYSTVDLPQDYCCEKDILQKTSIHSTRIPIQIGSRKR